jgi:hypothetical protein
LLTADTTTERARLGAAAPRTDDMEHDDASIA